MFGLRGNCSGCGERNAACAPRFRAFVWRQNKEIFVSEICHRGVCHLSVDTRAVSLSTPAGGTILHILPASSSATISLLHLFVWKPPRGWSSSSASVCVQTSCLMETPSLNIWTCPDVSSPRLMSSPSSEGGERTSPSQRTDECGGPNLCQRILVSFQSCAKC